METHTYYIHTGKENSPERYACRICIHARIHAYIQEERIRLKAMVAESDENMRNLVDHLVSLKQEEHVSMCVCVCCVCIQMMICTIWLVM
jgi:hypothetical protein